MTDNKTTTTGQSVKAFVDAIDDDTRRKDCRAVIAMMRRITGKRAMMWGPSIVGFGRYRYRYESGRSGEFFLVGVSPRKRNLVLYIMPGFAGFDALLKRLGKHSTGKSCLYINRLADVDVDVLAELVEQSVAHMRATHDCV